MAFDPKTEDTLEGPIVSLGEYHSYTRHKEQGTEFPAHSKRILDLKNKYERGLSYFFDYLSEKVKTPDAIAVVPSSDATKGPTSGCHALADRLCQKLGITNAGACLVRHTSIAKKAKGGDRSISVDLNSVRVENADLIKGKRVLLIDDVTTSGNSLLACRRLLLKAGAKDVKMVALGRTTQ